MVKVSWDNFQIQFRHVYNKFLFGHKFNLKNFQASFSDLTLSVGRRFPELLPELLHRRHRSGGRRDLLAVQDGAGVLDRVRGRQANRLRGRVGGGKVP